MVKQFFYADDDTIIEKFKKCEVCDYLGNEEITTVDWVKEGILLIIEKQTEVIDKMADDLHSIIDVTYYSGSLSVPCKEEIIAHYLKEIEKND